MKLKKFLLYVLGGASLVGVGVALGNEKCRSAIAEGAKKGASKVGGWFQKKESESQPSGEQQQPRDEKPRYNNEKPRYNNEKPRYNGQQNQNQEKKQ